MYTKCRFTGKKLLKPGLKLIGAKTKFRDLLYQLMNPHDIYIEPFAGSTTVLVGKAPASMEFIGDTNEYLMDYIHTLQDNPGEFWEEFQCQLPMLHEGQKEYFEEIRTWLTESFSRQERSLFFYMVTKTCTNGIFRLRKRDGACNSSFCKQTHARGWFTREWFDAVVNRYQEVTAVHGEYQTTIEMANDYMGKQFLFLDPPYRFKKGDNGAGTVTTYNGQKFMDGDFIELKQVMDNFPGDILMTINDDEWTRRLFKDYYQVQHDVNYSCSRSGTQGRGAHPELLVSTYPIKERYAELKSQLDAKKEAKTGVRKRSARQSSGLD